MDGFSEEAAVKWAAAQVKATACRSVTRHPWARTYRLTAEDGQYFLKATFNKRHAGGAHNARLSQIAAPLVPEVLRSSPENGLFIMRDFEAKPFSESLDDNAKARVLAAYGRIQARCFNDERLKKALPEVTCAEALATFEALLENALADKTGPDTAGNPFLYFSKPSVEGYRRIMRAMRPHLAKLFAVADTFPRTINHCDLRPKNTALRADRTPVIFDWDDAIWAPPGFSLHAQFSGAYRVHRALRAGADFENQTATRDARILAIYMRDLAKGPIEAEKLVDCLRATSLAGVLHYIAAFAPYPVSSGSSRTSIKRTIRRRMSDLFTLFEDMAAHDEALARDLAAAFRSTGRDKRAEETLAPWRVADMATAPENADSPALPFDITVNAEERKRGTWQPDTLDRAVAAYREHGTLILRDVFDRDLIKEAHARLQDDFGSFQSAIDQDAALRVGDRRFMVTPTLDGALLDEKLLASPFVLPIMKKLLSKSLVLGSATSVASAPGAKDQSIHRDNPHLFREAPELEVPHFLISLIVPLVPLTPETGTTRLWPGSHTKHYSNYEDCQTLDPLCDIGSCYLMDSRLFHQGLANRSDIVRPILAIIYQRPWYVDHKNFHKQDPLRLADPTGAALSEEMRGLLVRGLRRPDV